MNTNNIASNPVAAMLYPYGDDQVYVALERHFAVRAAQRDRRRSRLMATRDRWGAKLGRFTPVSGQLPATSPA
jgi:hypothetical protein